MSLEVKDSVKINTECFNTEGKKSLRLEIFDLDSNFRVVNIEFDLHDYLYVWSKLGHGIDQYYPSFFEFTNGYKIKITNTKTDEIEFSDILLTKPYSKTKFIDKDNVLPSHTTDDFNHNFIESFKKFRDDVFNIKNDEILIDLGSSVGLFTAYALEQNPNIKSICVEMNPSFHKVCVDTFKENSNIIPINAAIYKTSNEIIEMRSNKKDFYSLGSSIIGKNLEYTMKINTISLNDIINSYDINRISFLKVDIEGYEYELFKNLSDETISKIDKIFLEFHPVDDNNERTILINRLMANGFKINPSSDTWNYDIYMFSLFFTRN